MLGKEVLLSTTVMSADIDGDFDQKILKPPNEVRVRKLKRIVETLLDTRTAAFYHERSFTSEEAIAAQEKLDTVFWLSRALDVSERI